METTVAGIELNSRKAINSGKFKTFQNIFWKLVIVNDQSIGMSNE